MTLSSLNIANRKLSTKQSIPNLPFCGQQAGHQSPNWPPGWARRPCVCGGRALGKGDKKQQENKCRINAIVSVKS